MTGGTSGDSDANWRRYVNSVGLVALVVAVAVFVAIAVPGLVGADQSLVVLSDSMDPSIKAGAVVFVSDVPSDELSTGDVITFRQTESPESARVTHRIVEVVERDGERQFLTKGDANAEADQTPVSPRQVVGRVAFHVPLVGYVVSFASSSAGLVFLVVVPALLLVVTEVRDMVAAMNASEPPGDEAADASESLADEAWDASERPAEEGTDEPGSPPENGVDASGMPTENGVDEP